MPTTKKPALELIKKLPDKVSWDDIMDEMYVRKKIEAGSRLPMKGASYRMRK